jgi:hypothetical protein
MIALATLTGMLGLGSFGASAATVAPAAGAVDVSSVQKADWGYYCGPRCHYWRHRRAEATRHHWWREQEWREHYNPYYGYNYHNPYYR